MLLKKYKSIMEKPEKHRNRWALGLSVILSAVILVSFGFYKGYISFGSGGSIAADQSANQAAVISAKSAPSPIQNSKETFKTAFGEINKQYQEFKNSISDVLVPFITGIEVYERK